MKNVIYQYWRGEIPEYVLAVKQLFSDYAKRINAEHVFEHNPTFIRALNSTYYSALRPVFDKRFHEFDRVLFVDMDVIPVDGLEHNIFDEEITHIAMAEEVKQPALRANMTGKIRSENDLKWASVAERFWNCCVMRDEERRPRVFNSGVVLYTREGLKRAAKNAPGMSSYQLLMKFKGVPKFYRLDQNYLNLVVSMPQIDFSVLGGYWNAQLNRVGTGHGRSKLLNEVDNDTRFIHLQHSAKKQMSQSEVIALSKGQLDMAMFE